MRKTSTVKIENDLFFVMSLGDKILKTIVHYKIRTHSSDGPPFYFILRALLMNLNVFLTCFPSTIDQLSIQLNSTQLSEE